MEQQRQMQKSLMFEKQDFFKLPVSYFSMPMGLLGLGIEAHHFEKISALPDDFSSWVLQFAWTLLAIMAIFSLVKLLKTEGRQFLKLQWQNSISLLDFPILTLTALLLLLSLEDFSQKEVGWLAVFGMIVITHTYFNIEILTRWLHDNNLKLQDIRPTFFILLSGNFMVVIVGDFYLPKIYDEFLWFYFSVSLFLWFTFVFILFYRLIFEVSIQDTLRPSLFIVLSPPSLGLIAYALLSHATQMSAVTWVLFSFATFFFGMWFLMQRFFRKIRLTMIGWAFIYPLASYDVSLQVIYHLTNNPLILSLAFVVMVTNIVLSCILLYHMVRTLLTRTVVEE
ncbi:SLAC1 family transporter [Hydrogenovibrio kuenenii]|uniref:SLAC1 family transporter n=1 Tax=Hydrogenovibrio kuenenii TaxID=63658 RepID=UPI0004634363|nr:hypothetical protein [Hydrogenovibrio kuenenii]